MATRRVRLEFFFLETGKRWMTRGNNWKFKGTVCNFDPLESNDLYEVKDQLRRICQLAYAERVNHFYCSTGGNGLKVNPTNKKEVIIISPSQVIICVCLGALVAEVGKVLAEKKAMLEVVLDFWLRNWLTM